MHFTNAKAMNMALACYLMKGSSLSNASYQQMQYSA